jgi:Nitrile hydratase, alpha chain
MAEKPQNAELQIAARAARDEEFRQQLIRDPAATLEREFGARLPEGVTIQVHEETDDVVHLVVPGRLRRFENLPDDALDDTVLEMMRDGISGCCTCGSTTQQTFSTLQVGCGC